MKPMLKRNKYDIGLVPQALNNNNVTSRYFDMKNYRKLVAKAVVGAMATGTTATLALFEATSGAGANAVALVPAVFGVPTAASAVITANTNVTVATLTAAACAPLDTFVLNGLTYTGAAAADLPNRVFLADAADNNATAASIAAAINHATAGVPGVTATANAAVVTLTATEAGEATITVVGTAVRLVAATLQAIAAVEIDATQLDVNNDFQFVAARLTTTANTVIGVEIERGDARYEPTQFGAAQTIV